MSCSPPRTSRRPGGVPQVRPDGQRHHLGPRRLSRARLLGADTAWPRTTPRRADRANAVSGRVRQSARQTRRRPWTARWRRRSRPTSMMPRAARSRCRLSSKAAFDEQVAYWTRLLQGSGEERRPVERRGRRSGRTAPAHRVLRLDRVGLGRPAARHSHSYTNNFPYDPLVGNHQTGGALLWSAISLVFLLGGIADRAARLRQVRLPRLAWRPPDSGRSPAGARYDAVTPAQAATLKFMVVAAPAVPCAGLLGGARRALSRRAGRLLRLRPVGLSSRATCCAPGTCRPTIFWVATSYVAGALFVASALGGGDPKGQRPLVHRAFLGGRGGRRRQPARPVGGHQEPARRAVVLDRQSGLGVSGDRPVLADPAGGRACCSGSGWCAAPSQPARRESRAAGRSSSSS